MAYSHRDLCKIAASYFLQKTVHDLVCWELRLNRSSVLDVVAVCTKRKTPKISFCEVKRTRSDLLQDLRKQKMLKYQTSASHYYLAATPTALRLETLTRAQVREDLCKRGLPPHWGVLVLPENPLGRKPYILKRPKQQLKPLTRTIGVLVRKIAVSMCYRVLATTSPMSD